MPLWRTLRARHPSSVLDALKDVGPVIKCLAAREMGLQHSPGALLHGSERLESFDRRVIASASEKRLACMSGSNAVHLTRISDNLQVKYSETISLGNLRI